MSIRWLPVVTLAVVATDAALLAFGVISLPVALVAIVLIELPLAALSLVRYVKLYRAERAAGAAGALIRVADRDPLLRVALGELRLFASLGRWILRRPDVPRGAVPVGYARGALAIPSAFAVAALIEMVVVHVLVPWPVVRTVLALLSLYGLLFLLAWMGSLVVRPHLVYPDTLVLRHGSAVVGTVGRANIAGATAARLMAMPKDYLNTSDDGAHTLTLAGPDGTNVRLDLRDPVHVVPPGMPWRRHRGQAVTRIRLQVDDPHALDGLCEREHARRVAD